MSLSRKIKYLALIALIALGELHFCAMAQTPAPGRNSFLFEELTQWGSGEENTFQQLPPSGFAMSVKTGDSRAIQTACVTREMTVVGQDKLIFTVVGTPDNQGSQLHVLLLFRSGEESYDTRWSKPITITSNIPKQYSLGISEEFGGADLASTVSQIKFQLDSGDEPQGHVSSIQIKDVAIRSAGEEGALKGGAITVAPSPRPLEVVRAEAPELKLYFDFDNDDQNLQLNTRWTTFVGEERYVTPGFRDRLMEGTAGLLTEVATPGEADVIVVSRTNFSLNAASIANAVRQGAGLLYYGDVYDPELAALLPVRLESIMFEELPERAELEISDDAQLLYGGERPQGEYAFFRHVEALPGSRVLASLGNEPATVASGAANILYSTIGIGVGQLKSRDLYDLFFLKSAALTGGKPELAARMDVLERRLQLLREIRDRRDVAEVLGKEELAQTLSDWEKKACASLPDEQLQEVVQTLEASLAAQNMADFSANGLRFYAGAHQNNFGRFGWALDEGLLGANVSKTLSVSNGVGEYIFSFEVGELNSIEMGRWSRESVEGDLQSSDPQISLETTDGAFDFEWLGKGMLRYRTQVMIPEEWRGLPLFFEVEKGIDDADVTFFNGQKIGSIDKNTPGYWMEPRRYEIAPELVKYGEKNEVVCEVTNYEGSATFNGKPALRIVRPGRDKTVTVSSLDWIHKQYTVRDAQSRAFDMTLSLVLPYVLYETEQRQAGLTMENLADYLAFVDAAGKTQVVALGDTDFVYDRERDGKLGAPYLLFYQSTRPGRPLAVYFAENPARITTQSAYGMLSAIAFEGGERLGAIAVGWPFGASDISCSDWTENLPEAVSERMQAQAQLVFNFPVGMKEIYAIDEASGVVQLRNRFTLRHLENEFEIAPARYAVLPPLAGFAVERKLLATCDQCEDFQLTTDAGPLLGVRDSDTIAFTLALPPEGGFNLMNVAGGEKYKAMMKRIFNLAVRWACGGYFPERCWTPGNPQGESFLSRNFDLCSWGFNLIYCFQSLPFMEAAERTRLQQRAGWRFFEPLERYGHKLAFRYREEPFSYVRYPVMLPPFYKSTVNFAEQYGSHVVFGDENEPGYILPVIARLGGDFMGQAGVTKVNYHFLRDTMAFTLASEDWAVQTSGCRESWQGAFIDMLNCEYPMMREYRRIAQYNQDDAAARDALYRASRKMLPTVMRFYFQDFMKDHQLANADKDVRFITGWTENSGASFILSGSNYGATDIFDVAGGVSEYMLILLKTYANEPIRESMLRTTMQVFSRGETYEYPSLMALFGMDRNAIYQELDKVDQNPPLLYTEDHPGMSVFYHVGLILFSEHPEIFLDGVEDLTLLRAEYDPQSRVAQIEYLPGKQAKLRVYAAFVPSALQQNGATVAVPETAKNSVMEFVGGEGVQRLKITLGDTPNQYRHVMLKNLMQ